MRKFPRLLAALLTVPVLAGLIAFRSPTQQPGAPLSQGVERGYQAPWGPAREGVAEPELGRVPIIYRSDARAIISRQFYRLTHRWPNSHELELIQLTAWVETQYGMGWGVGNGAGAGSNNWGAITAPCGPMAFRSLDHDHNGNTIQACFAIYPTPTAGARELVKWFLRRPEILAAESLEEAVALMYDAGFFVGSGDSREERIEKRLLTYYVARGNNATGGNYGNQ